MDVLFACISHSQSHLPDPGHFYSSNLSLYKLKSLMQDLLLSKLLLRSVVTSPFLWWNSRSADRPCDRSNQRLYSLETFDHDTATYNTSATADHFRHIGAIYVIKIVFVEQSMKTQSPSFGLRYWMKLYESMRGENELTMMDVSFLQCGEDFRVARRASGVNLFRRRIELCRIGLVMLRNIWYLALCQPLWNLYTFCAVTNVTECYQLAWPKF